MKNTAFEQERNMSPEFMRQHAELMSAACEAYQRVVTDDSEVAYVMTGDSRYGQLTVKSNEWYALASLWLKDSDGLGYSLYLETDLSGSLDLRGWARLPQLMWWEELENGWGDAVVVNSNQASNFKNIIPESDFREFIAPDVIADLADLRTLHIQRKKLGQQIIDLT